MENRLIKFRAWDMLRKEFLPTDCYAVLPSCDFGATAVMIKDFDNYRAGEYFYDKSQVLMQFTGLLDKNGKEIYEGDIVAIFYSKEGAETDEVYLKDVVEYGVYDIGVNGYEYSFSVIGPHVKDEFLYSYLVAGNATVIGNIFEHPELITPRH